jgi:hypothetical protein
MKYIFVIVLLSMTLMCSAPPDNLNICVRKSLKKNVLLADAIKYVESRGNYSVYGGSGEYGAYQIMPKTWLMWSKQTHNKILKMTPANQDSVVIRKIRYWTKHYSYREIASIWNSGSPRWMGKIGINKHGVKYNVPEYVKKVDRVYNRLKKHEKYWKIEYYVLN